MVPYALLGCDVHVAAHIRVDSGVLRRAPEHKLSAHFERRGGVLI